MRKPVAQELNAQQKNLSILQEGKQGAAAFSVYGLQDARFVTAASSQGLTVSKNATAVAVISPKMEHDMVYMLVTRVRAPSQLVFLGLELNSFLTRKPQPHLALYLQRFDQNELYFFSDLLTSLKNYSLGLGLVDLAEKFFGIAEKRREDCDSPVHDCTEQHRTRHCREDTHTNNTDDTITPSLGSHTSPVAHP